MSLTAWVPLVVLLVAPPAWGQAAPPSDVSITTLGYQQIDSASVDVANEAQGTDVRFFLGERLRWRLGNGDGVGTVMVRALADARFTVDPAANFEPGEGQSFETNNVRQLGVELTHQRFTLDIGRHPIFRGGPRLVDGVQALYRPSPVVDVGFWGGLAPDFFETDFQVRPGFGPVVAYTASRVQASLVGDFAFANGGLDRAAVLGTARLSSNRLVEVFGRVDLELASADGGPHLSDLQLYTIYTPADAVRLDLVYNAFSSYQYITTAEADPEAQRFDLRLGQISRDLGLVQIRQDPTVNHMVGATARFQGKGSGVRPRAELMARYRHNADRENRFARLTPTLGLLNVGGKVDLLASSNLLAVDAAVQVDGGLNVVWNASDIVAIDVSGRALTSPEYAGMGFYADAFVDWVIEGPEIILMGGLSYLSEPAADTPDGGPGLFLRASKYLRPRKKPLEATAPAATSTPSSAGAPQ